MSNEIIILTSAAASIGFLHTLLGPDHYVPFVVMARAGRWSRLKTLFLTLFCGIGHVASSMVLGITGIFMGIAVSRLEVVEVWRGEVAAWALIAFGLVYFIWGMRKACRSKPHEHFHVHREGPVHIHTHTHDLEHLHPHGKTESTNFAPWVLFIIFVFGPCEPLIPLLMYPAAKNSLWGMLWVTTVFSVFTIGTMLTIILAMSFGFSRLSFKPMEKYSHALAGAIICLSGVGVKFLGL